MNSELDHVAVRTADLAESIRFYEALLGTRSVTLLAPNDDIGQVELVQVGHHHGIELFEQGRGQASKDSPSTGLIHLALGVDDVDSAYADSVQSGAEPMLARFRQWSAEKWTRNSRGIHLRSGRRVD